MRSTAPTPPCEPNSNWLRSVTCWPSAVTGGCPSHLRARLRCVRAGAEVRHAEARDHRQPTVNRSRQRPREKAAVGDDDGFTPHPLTSEQVAAVAQHIAVVQEAALR